jgi:predicted nucleotidyltransferase component of viral defense system
MIWSALKIKERQNTLNEVYKRVKFPLYIIEKDWWVVQTLRLITQMDIAEHLVFKGGTSLSKAWGLIDRFSYPK